MNSQITGLRVAGTIFGLVCLGHLLRILTGFRVLLGDFRFRIRWSALVALLAAALCLWLWKLSFPSAQCADAQAPQPKSGAPTP